MKRGLFILALLVLIAALVAGMTGCTKQKPVIAEATATETLVVEAGATTTPSPPATVIGVTEATPTQVAGIPPLTPTPEAGEEATPTGPSPSPTPTFAVTPAAAATVPVPTPTVVPGAEVTYYTVQRGDTLSSIARRFNTTVEAILQANNIANPNYIYAGQSLVIPEAGETPPSPPGAPPGEGRVHVVGPGENLFRIALRYGVTIEDIARANNIVNPRYIYVGQELTIP
jgi:LysM repeat protein